MFKALIIQTSEKWSSRLKTALFSMNFECIFVPDLEAAVTQLKKDGAGIGIIFVPGDDETTAHNIQKQQEKLGFNRPLVGLVSHVSEGLANQLNSNISLDMEEMALRQTIDDAFILPNETQKHVSKDKAKKPLRVLVIEDHQEQAELLSQRLLQKGYEPFVALNGVSGKNEIDFIKPDIVLMDINIPIIDGVSLTKIIKSDPIIKHIPVIGISANDRRMECLEAGCSEFFLKPYKFLELIEVMEKVVEIRLKQA